MNYAYFPAFGIDGDYYSLATTKSQYSTGILPPIIEDKVGTRGTLDRVSRETDRIQVCR